MMKTNPKINIKMKENHKKPTKSSRSGYMRGKEHAQDLLLKNEGGHLMKHLLAEHPEIDLEQVKNRQAKMWFKMEMVSQHMTAMDRQLSEALAIARAGGVECPQTLNSADEYNRFLLPEMLTNTEFKLRERTKRERERADMRLLRKLVRDRELK